MLNTKQASITKGELSGFKDTNRSWAQGSKRLSSEIVLSVDTLFGEEAGQQGIT